MEICVGKNAFLKAINMVGNVTATKNATLPILGNLLIEAFKDNRMQIVGTDLELGISTTIDCQVQKEGSITIPAKKLQEIIRELPEGEVELAVAKNNAVNIKAGKAYFKILGLTKEDYPKLPEFDPKNGVELDQAVLKEGLSLTLFAISYDETRYVLNGVLFSFKDKRAKFVATDGRRLAFINKEITNKEQTMEMIVPAKTIQELLKVLAWDGVVRIIPLTNQAVFDFGGTYLVSRLIEGHFPNYEQVVPKEHKTNAEVDRDEFLQAIRRTALLTSTDSPAVKIDFLKGKVLVSSKSPNLGEAKEEMEAKVQGAELAIGFNPNYLIDVLKNLDVNTVTFSLSDPDKPGLIKGKEDYLYVIMPMQIS